MRNRCDILNILNTESQSVQGTDSRLAAGAWPADANVNIFDTELERSFAGLVRRNLSCKRGRFTRATESTTAGRCPRESITLAIGNRDDRVIEGSMDVRYRVNHVLFDLLLFRFCHVFYLLVRPLAAFARYVPLGCKARSYEFKSLSLNGTTRTFACACIGTGSLTA